MNSTNRRLVAFPLLLATGACFSTFQNARIDPGFRIDAGAILLTDQTRHTVRQGPDLITYLAPVYGFEQRVELGIPVAIYDEGILSSNASGPSGTSVLVMPYLKLGLLPLDSKSHLAVIAQSSYIAPANVGIRFGRERGTWEPHIGATYVFSGGAVGDDPSITRYQEENQTMFAVSAGATLLRPHRTAFEIGVLRNSYDEITGFDPGGARIVHRTLYDLFVGVRMNLLRTR
jgi:hypothetical protein